MAQRTFFDDEPPDVPEWETLDAEESWRARVVFTGGTPGEFDYKIPDRLVEAVRPGMRLLVPLGRGIGRSRRGVSRPFTERRRQNREKSRFGLKR